MDGWMDGREENCGVEEMVEEIDVAKERRK